MIFITFSALILYSLFTVPIRWMFKTLDFRPHPIRPPESNISMPLAPSCDKDESVRCGIIPMKLCEANDSWRFFHKMRSIRFMKNFDWVFGQKICLWLNDNAIGTRNGHWTIFVKQNELLHEILGQDPEQLSHIFNFVKFIWILFGWLGN